MEYTAIATVADVMDLQDENRIMVKKGLKMLAHTKNEGLKALIQVCQLNPSKISAYHIGFVLGPCFNAAGRLDTVKIALDLLMETDPAEAAKKASALKDLNESRKNLTVKGFEQAVEKIENQGLQEDKVILVKLENCHESLVGIIAGRIKEKYHRPTLVFTDVGDGRIKGSGRSIEAYNMFEELHCSEAFAGTIRRTSHGGRADIEGRKSGAFEDGFKHPDNTDCPGSYSSRSYRCCHARWIYHKGICERAGTFGTLWQGEC